MKYTQISLLLLASATVSPSLYCGETQKEGSNEPANNSVVESLLQNHPQLGIPALLAIRGIARHLPWIVKMYTEKVQNHIEVPENFYVLMGSVSLEALQGSEAFSEQVANNGSAFLPVAAQVGDVEMVSFLLNRGYTAHIHEALLLACSSRLRKLHSMYNGFTLNENVLPSLPLLMNFGITQALIQIHANNPDYLLTFKSHMDSFKTDLQALSLDKLKMGISLGFDILGHIIEVHDGEAVKCARLLIDAGADVNAKESETLNSPLHYAHRDDNQGMIELLCAAGADEKALNAQGQSPQMYGSLEKAACEQFNKRIPDETLNAILSAARTLEEPIRKTATVKQPLVATA